MSSARLSGSNTGLHPHPIQFLCHSYIYLFHIGDGHPGQVQRCGGSSDNIPYDAQTAVNNSGLVHRTSASTPSGPWEPLPGIPGVGCNNPAPMAHPNGTIYVGCGNGDNVQLYVANDIEAGHWSYVTNIVVPAAWRTSKGWGCNAEFRIFTLVDIHPPKTTSTARIPTCTSTSRVLGTC